jgi:putative sterol carrier protein
MNSAEAGHRAGAGLGTRPRFTEYVFPHPRKTENSMSLATLTEQIQQIAERHDLDALVKFDLGDAGVIFIDGKQQPPVVDNDDREAEVTVHVTERNLGKLLDGSLNAMTAVMTKKIKIEGNMGLAMKLGQMLS